MRSSHRNLHRTVAAVSATALLTFGCGFRSGLEEGNGTLPADGAGGAAPVGVNGAVGGTAGSGGMPGSGGVTGNDAVTYGTRGSGGIVGLGGMVGSGGATVVGGGLGTGANTPDASTQLVCGEDGGIGLPAAARQCTQDSDCDFVAAVYCCAAARAFGVAKLRADSYRACTMTIGLCGGMGCPRSNAYETDTGRLTTQGPNGTMPLNLVSVRCVNQLCTTDAV